jgi:hypothetical protein
MSNVSATSFVVREPCRTSLLAAGGRGVGTAVGRVVGRAVGCGVGRAVRIGVGRAVGTAVCVAVAVGVGLVKAVPLAEGAGGDGLRTGEDIAVGAHVGSDERGEGPSEAELGVAPQPTMIKAAARISVTIERGTRESQIVMSC